MFTRDLSALECLKNILPLDDITETAYRAAFAKRVNAKETFADRSYDDLDVRTDAFEDALGRLGRHGRPD